MRLIPLEGPIAKSKALTTQNSHFPRPQLRRVQPRANQMMRLAACAWTSSLSSPSSPNQDARVQPHPSSRQGRHLHLIHHQQSLSCHSTNEAQTARLFQVLIESLPPPESFPEMLSMPGGDGLAPFLSACWPAAGPSPPLARRGPPPRGGRCWRGPTACQNADLLTWSAFLAWPLSHRQQFPLFSLRAVT